jgi:nucleotide-binding universal stress UspA family protein
MAQSLIVHPTDLNATSEGAYYHALKLGIAGRSRLALVHVHTYKTEQTPGMDAFPSVRETLARWGLLPAGASQAQVSEKLGLTVTKGEVLAMDAEAGLAKLLRDKHAAMMVLGTRGLTGLQRLFESSFSEHLAREAKIPALFVPSGAEGFVDPRDGAIRLDNVLVPLAEDPDSSGAIQAALGMADLFGQDPQFHLLHVGRAGSIPPVQLNGRRRSREILRQGQVVETIGHVAEEVGADLIVMATAGHKGFLDALRGSTTEGVLRTAHRALLAVPAE